MAKKRGRAPTPSENAMALWMVAEDVSPIEIARSLRWSVNKVNRLRAGMAVPNLPDAVALDRLSDGGIPPESWVTDLNPIPLRPRRIRRRPEEPERAAPEPAREDKLAAS